MVAANTAEPGVPPHAVPARDAGSPAQPALPPGILHCSLLLCISTMRSLLASLLDSSKTRPTSNPHHAPHHSQVVTNLYTFAKETYVLYQCGTAAPNPADYGLPAATKVLAVPLTAVSVQDTTVLNFMVRRGAALSSVCLLGNTVHRACAVHMRCGSHLTAQHCHAGNCYCKPARRHTSPDGFFLCVCATCRKSSTCWTAWRTSPLTPWSLACRRWRAAVSGGRGGPRGRGIVGDSVSLPGRCGAPERGVGDS